MQHPKVLNSFGRSPKNSKSKNFIFLWAGPGQSKIESMCIEVPLSLLLQSNNNNNNNNNNNKKMLEELNILNDHLNQRW